MRSGFLPKVSLKKKKNDCLSSLSNGLKGINVNLYTGSNQHSKVVQYQGPSHVAIQKVPCNVTGSIQLGLVTYGAPLSANNFFATPLNHRLGKNFVGWKIRSSNGRQESRPFGFVHRRQRRGCGFHEMR